MNTAANPASAPVREEDRTVHRFDVMGTSAELQLRAPHELAAPLLVVVEAELRRLQAIMTRFDPDSPIERLNDAGGGTPDSPELAAVLARSLAAWRETEGRVDVGVGTAMVEAGYDRDFDDLRLQVDELAVQQQSVTAIRERRAAGPSLDLREVRAPLAIDPMDGSITIPDGVRIDLGGIAKGWAADQACAMLRQHGSCIANLGGDMALHVAEGEDSWPVGVQVGAQSATFDIAWGGIATSGIDRRVWKVGDELRHHLIDPTTGRPASSDVLRVTVFADSCADAEVWTKALYLRGADEAVREASERGITAIVTDLEERVRCTGGLASWEPPVQR
jgi:thiamine biosynthesis lipoprotein